MSEFRYTEQITVLELLIQCLDEQLNRAIDRTQEIDNLLYAQKHLNPLNLKEYIGETRK